MTEHDRPIDPPTQAGPAGRAFHTLIALGGWMLFIYWWWLVFSRVSRDEVRFTLLFVAISFVAIVGITALWAWHNMGIHRRRGPRTRLREVTPDFSHDGVGRPVTVSGPATERSTAPVVHVRLTDEGKSYEPAAALPPRPVVAETGAGASPGTGPR